MSDQSGFINEICSRLERVACESETLRIQNRRLVDANADLLEALKKIAVALDRFDSGHPLVSEAMVAIANAKGHQ